MQLFVQVEVEKPPITQPMYNLWYLDDNNIESEGCIYLSKSKWNNLQKLNLSISNLI